MRHSEPPKSLSLGAVALIATAASAAAVGAFAIGALAIGRLAVRRFTVDNAEFKSMDVGELHVKRPHAAEVVVTGSLSLPGPSGR